MQATISKVLLWSRAMSIAVVFATCAGAALAQGGLTPDAAITAEPPSLLRELPFKDKQAANGMVSKALKAPGTLRARLVDIDFSVLQTVRAEMIAADRPQTLRIPFFDDASMLVEITAIMPTASGGHGYAGRVAGSPQSMVVMVDNDGTVSINVSMLARRYVIQGTAKSGYIARELAEQDRPDHGNRVVPEINAPPLPKKAASSSSAADRAEIAADTGNQIDVMVVYTPAAREDHGGTAQIHAAVDAQIVLINQIYATSNVVQRLRLVYKGEVAHTEFPDSGTDLDRLASPNDGVMDEVPRLRDVYQADIVSLWGNYPDVCGIGFLMTTESSGFAANAYNIVNSPDCTGGNSYTMAHELGHNMGLRHDNFADTTPNTTVTLESNGVQSVIAYAHGYIDLANRFRTVMSYNDQCLASPPNTSCTRIPYFSNPGVLYIGATTGNATNAHERQALNDTRETVANFRQGLASLNGPGVLVFSKPIYSVAEGDGSVTLTVTRHAGSTGAVSVSYSTSDSAATAGSDYTATSGTLSWANGDTGSRTITINISQDTLVEGTEIFLVVVNNPVGGVSISVAGAITDTIGVNIVDDDIDPLVSNCAFAPGFTAGAGFVTPATANAGWSTSTVRARTGSCSIRSNPIPSLASAQTQVSGNFAAGTISFYYSMSSEQNWDCLRFLVDDNERAEMGVCAGNGGSGASGETGWILVNVLVNAGFHTFTWSYEKDGSATEGADAAWIDDVVLPPLVTAILTVAKAGNGAGTVSGTGINCGLDCTEAVVPGTMIALTATPLAGSSFTGWSGGGCSGTAGCDVTLNAATNVTATFTLQPVTLTVLLSGTGLGGVSSNPAGISTGPGDNTEPYAIGTVVTLTAVAQAGATFIGWSGGGCSGTGTCTVTMNAATTVTAAFNIVLTLPGPPTIGVVSPGNGQATINFSPPASSGGMAITGYIATCANGPIFTASGPFSPITVTGLTNGIGIGCAVAAINSVGTGPDSSAVNVTPSAMAPLVLIGAQSRKTHAAFGPFNVPIATGVPIGGEVSVESRAGSSGHAIAFMFNDTVTAPGTVSVAPVGSATVASFSGNELLVTLTGVPDNRRVTVTLAGVNGSFGTAVSLGFMAGDVNGNRAVNASDISSVKAHLNQAANGSNFRFDLNADGTVNQADVSTVKARSGLVLP